MANQKVRKDCSADAAELAEIDREAQAIDQRRRELTHRRRLITDRMRKRGEVAA